MGAAYAVAAWVVLQVLDVVGDILELPAWGGKLLLAIIVAGFFVTLFAAWAFELTPEGIKRESEVDRAGSITPETGRRLDRVILGLLVLAVVFLMTRQFSPDRGDISVPSTATATESSTGQLPYDLTEATSVGIASIAVLPFTTRSTSQEDQFFSDGLHDDLLTQLAKLGGLKVISRTSVLEYRDTVKNLRQVGEELGVANIVEGGVQRSGGQVRINMQLIDAQTDAHLWADNWTREVTADNLFAIQSEIVRAITQALHTTLTPEEQKEFEQAPTQDLAALEAYRRSRHISSIFDEKVLLTALQEARRAVELDSEFAEAWAQLSYILSAKYWGLRPQDTSDLEESWAALERARALKPHSPEAAMAEAYYWYRGYLEYDRALQSVAPAIERYPNHPELLQAAAIIHRRQGHPESAIELLHRAIELSPLDRELLYTAAETELGRWNYPQARILNDKVLALDPTYFRSIQAKALLKAATTDDAVGAAELVGQVYRQVPEFSWAAFSYHQYLIEARQYEEALALARSGFDTRPYGPEFARMLEGITLFLMGKREEAETLLKSAIPAFVRQSDPDTNQGRSALGTLCVVHGALGDKVQAREYCRMAREAIPNDLWSGGAWHEAVYQGLALANLQEEALDVLEHAMSYPYLTPEKRLRRDPLLSNIHGNPRFEEIMASTQARMAANAASQSEPES